MKRVISLILVLAIMIASTPFVMAANALTVSTLSATSVGTDGAVLRGQIETNGEKLVKYYQFAFREEGGTWNWIGYVEDHRDSYDIYKFEVTDLEPGTTYEFEFQAVSEDASLGAAYGGVLSFTTDCDHEYSEEVIDTDIYYEDYDYHYFDEEIEYTCDNCGDSYSEWIYDEEGEKHDWNSSDSTCTICDCVLPEITIAGFGIADEYELGETIGFYGSLSGNGSNITKVTVNIHGPDSHSVGGQYFTKTVGAENYSLSNISNLTTGTGLVTEPGTYWICIWVVDAAGNGMNSASANSNGTFVYSFDLVDTCNHEEEKEVQTGEHYSPVNDDTHNYIEIYKVVCANCGILLEETKTYETEEDHQFDTSGECSLCGYIKTEQLSSPVLNRTSLDTTVDSAVTFSWDQVDNATEYSFYISDGNGNVVVNSANQTNLSYTYVFSEEGTYYVEVYATNNTSSVYTQSNPGKATVVVSKKEETVTLTASSNEVEVNTGLTFTAESNADSLTLTIVDVATGAIAGPYAMTKNGSTFTYYHEKLTNAGEKKAYAETPNGTKSNEVTITVMPAVVTLATPVYTGATTATVGDTVTISWNAVENATGYTCHLYDASMNKIDLTNAISGAKVSYTFTEVGSYGVQIYATAAGYNTSAACEATITVEAAAETITLTATPSGEIAEGTNVAFEAVSNSANVTLYIDAFNGETGERYTAVTKEMTKNGTAFIAENQFTTPGKKIVWAETADGTASEEIEITVTAAEVKLDAPEYTGATMATVGEQITFSWTAVENAARYTAWVRPVNNEDAITDLTGNISDQHVSYAFTEAGNYYLEIYAVGEDGYGTSDACSVTITVNAVEVTVTPTVTPTATPTPTPAITVTPDITVAPDITPEPICPHTAYTDTYDPSVQPVFESYTETSHWVKNGYNRICNACGGVIDSGYFPAVEERHTLVNNKCTVCSYMYIPADAAVVYNVTLSSESGNVPGVTCEEFILTVVTNTATDKLEAMNNNKTPVGFKYPDAWTVTTNDDGTKTWTRSYSTQTAHNDRKWTVTPFYKGVAGTPVTQSTGLKIINAHSYFEVSKTEQYKYYDASKHAVVTTVVKQCRTCGVDATVTQESYAEHKYDSNTGKCQAKGCTATVTGTPVTTAPVTVAPVTNAPVTAAPATTAPTEETFTVYYKFITVENDKTVETPEQKANGTIVADASKVDKIAIYAKGSNGSWAQPDANTRYRFNVYGDKNVFDLAEHGYSGTITGIGSVTVDIFDEVANKTIATANIMIASGSYSSSDYEIIIEYENEEGKTQSIAQHLTTSPVLYTSKGALDINFVVKGANGKEVDLTNLRWDFSRDDIKNGWIPVVDHQFLTAKCTLVDLDFYGKAGKSEWTCRLYRKGGLFGIGEETIKEFTLTVDRTKASAKRYSLYLSYIKDYSYKVPAGAGDNYNIKIVNNYNTNPKVAFSVIDLYAGKEINAKNLTNAQFSDLYTTNDSYNVNFYLTLDDSNKQYPLMGEYSKNGQRYATAECLIELEPWDTWDFIQGKEYTKNHTIKLWRNNYVIDTFTIQAVVYDADYVSPGEQLSNMFNDIGTAVHDAAMYMLYDVAVGSFVAVEGIIYQVTEGPDVSNALKTVGTIGEVDSVIKEQIVKTIVLEDLIGYSPEAAEAIYKTIDFVSTVTAPARAVDELDSVMGCVDLALYADDIQEQITDYDFVESDTTLEINGMTTIIDFVSD